RQSDLDRRGGADIGARRHDSDVARIQQIGAGAGGAGAAGGDIGGDRHPGCQDGLDRGAHRGVERPMPRTTWSALAGPMAPSMVRRPTAAGRDAAADEETNSSMPNSAAWSRRSSAAGPAAGL